MRPDKRNINRLLFEEFAIVWVLGFLLSSFSLTLISAADTATVAATVTAQNISVSISDGSITYGTIALSGTNDTTDDGIDDSQTATNNGNVTQDINIRGQNSANWTLGATQASEQYFHKYCKTTCDSSPTWTALTTSYQQLANSLSASGTQVFDLQVGLPTATASFTQQSVDVVVQAVAD